MGLLEWLRDGTNRGAGDRPPAVRPTMLTVLERRRLMRAKRKETYRRAWERFVEAQERLLAAEGLDELNAAALDLSVAAAELRLLHEMPHE